MESGEPEKKIHEIDIAGAQAKIDFFMSKWNRPLYQLCNNDQKLAVWYLWIRFLLAIRSLRLLAPHNDIAGCNVMARCCLEYDVSISAILRKPELGRKYVQYDVHAKNRFLEAQRPRHSDIEIADIEQYMMRQFGSDFGKKKASSWHGGFKQLCKVADRMSDMELYTAYCQYAHGTITGMYMLNNEGLLNMQRPSDSANKLLMLYTLTFLKTSDEVIRLIYTDLWSPEKDVCFKEFDEIMESIAKPQ